MYDECIAVIDRLQKETPVQTALLIAALPKRLREYAVGDLAVGESAYVCPAALIVGPNRECRLQTDAPIRPAADGDAMLHITRTPRGYIADITLCAHQWTPTARPDDASHAVVEHIVFGDEFLQ